MQLSTARRGLPGSLCDSLTRKQQCVMDGRPRRLGGARPSTARGAARIARSAISPGSGPARCDRNLLYRLAARRSASSSRRLSGVAVRPCTRIETPLRTMTVQNTFSASASVSTAASIATAT